MSDVLKYLGSGRKNAIKRTDLAIKCGLSDRKMRREIESLQHQGHRIINMSDSSGYYIASTEQEFEAYLKQEWHRIGKEMRKLHAMKKAENSAVTNE